MKENQVKSFRFMGGVPTHIYNGIVDVFVTLEGDDFEYWVEIATPQALSSHMEKNKENFIEPGYPCIIVHELTHLLVSNHTQDFWNRVSAQLPNYDKAKLWLKENGHELETDF